MTKTLIKFLEDYRGIITYGVSNDCETKEITDAIYQKEFNKYIRKGISPRVEELGYVEGFVEVLRKNGNGTQAKSQNQQRQKVLKDAEDIRNALHNLDLDDETDRKDFYQNTVAFIRKHEGLRKKKYDDGSGNVTVGIGFNMDKINAKEEWLQVFPDNNPSFENIKNGSAEFDESDAIELCKYNIQINETSLRTFLYDKNTNTSIYDTLNCNEQAPLISASFNGAPAGKKGSIIGTKQKRLLTDYVVNQDSNALDKAIHDLHNSSNCDVRRHPDKKGLLDRRAAEGELINSNKIPQEIRLLPGQKLETDVMKKVKVLLGMAVPNKHRTRQEYSHGDYFIWQHRSLSKNPNPLHIIEDGKIYKVGSEQWHWLNDERWKGCMCIMEQVDENIKVV